MKNGHDALMLHSLKAHCRDVTISLNYLVPAINNLFSCVYVLPCGHFTKQTGYHT